MRIQSIRFKNLNSLLGEWKIDLTDPAFSADGIFAITGPTGSGKSTILDAICLALYGRTPRLNRVNKSTNEIMSRQTGECFAEVCFETQSEDQTKRYVCHWSQHRARKKAQGELQNPRHEISYADSGEVLEHQLSAVARRIIRISGMDFERFTRSMLLAQGGFAAFLQADADERAPILEQITGTEIYSQISIKVHEYRSIEHKILDNLAAEMSGMELLSTEEESLLTTALSEKKLAEESKAKEHKEKNRFIQWRLLIDRCEKEQQILQQRQQESQQRLLDFQVQQRQLAQARKALELSGDYATLSALRKEQQSSKKQCDEYQKILPEQEEQLQKSEKLLTIDAAALEQNISQQKQQMEVIRQVRDLDSKIKEKEIPIQAAKEKLLETEVSLQSCQKKIARDANELEQKNIKWRDFNDIITKTQYDEPLVEQLTGINTQCSTLRELDLQKINKQQELDESKQQNKKFQKSFADQTIVLAAKKKSLSELQNNYDESQHRLNLLLENKEISVWRNELSQYKDKQRVLNDIVSQSEELELMKLEEAAGNKQYILLHNDGQKYAAEIRALIPAIKIIEREIILLDKNLALQNKIQALDEERKKLKDNECCPLCGAKDHPYAQGNIPDANQTKIELDEAKQRLSEHKENLSELQIKQIGNSKESEQINKQKNRLLQKIKQISGQIKGLSETLGDALTDMTLEQRLLENNESIVRCSSTLDSIDALDLKMRNYRENLDKSKEALRSLELNNKTNEHQLLSSEKTSARLALELKHQGENLTQNLSNIQEEVTKFNIHDISLASLDATQALLSQRRDQWLKNNDNKNKLEQKIYQLKIEQKHQHESSKKLEKGLRDQQTSINRLSQICDELQVQRQILFADKNPDKEADSLLSAVEKSEQLLQKSRRIYEGDRQKFLQLTTNIAAIDKEITKRDIKLKQAEDSFKIRLSQLEFDNEESFKHACLSEEQRNKLIQQEKILIIEQTELAVKIRDNNKKLDHERQKNLSEQSIEQLQLDFVRLENQLKELQGELGAIRQKLEDNAALREVQQSRATLIDKQKKECHQWDVLHDLIGSADGKKYRNFAQGLTFEMMVGHANQQLQKMTQRYLLIRDEQQPLELNVVDNFQAGEIRSTKNLSGGESFIVSLSLALGLSQMASKNVRVDSLFLDEGFGTLDEEALDTALETLSGLQQEGKLIGVISHVQALKDRISTQILVNPLNGGRSEIIGQGCTSISGESAEVLEN